MTIYLNKSEDEGGKTETACINDTESELTFETKEHVEFVGRCGHVLAWEMPLDRTGATSTLCFLTRVTLLWMPAGLLINKPGITTPDEQVQEAKHLRKRWDM